MLCCVFLCVQRYKQLPVRTALVSFHQNSVILYLVMVRRVCVPMSSSKRGPILDTDSRQAYRQQALLNGYCLCGLKWG